MKWGEKTLIFSPYQTHNGKTCSSQFTPFDWNTSHRFCFTTVGQTSQPDKMENNLSDVGAGLRSHSLKVGTSRIRGRRDGQQEHGSWIRAPPTPDLILQSKGDQI